ncbi:MAG: exodeoxyribonuclease VII large subunit [Acutalibacteraceae bacterium]
MPEAISVTVSQLNRYIKAVMDSDCNLHTLFVSGEISNFTNHYRTGHYYLTLKDEKSSIKAVMFRSDNERLGFMPENGMHVIARGRVSVFERDGQYQLYIEDMQPDGAGALSIAFEQLKKKLEAEGLFSPERKKPIPRFPRRVGVVTSPTGAAVRDIINVISRRSPSTQIILCPVQVQGASAAGQIADAIKRFNSGKYADVLIVGRGGGSVEELWAFNEEKVARAVACSRIPVISAVGHETDFTICDFAADLRAPTPSAAAELAVSDRAEQHAYIDQLCGRCASALGSVVRYRYNELTRIRAQLIAYGPQQQIIYRRQELDSVYSDMCAAAENIRRAEKSRLSVLAGRLDALSPLRILSGGYAAVEHGGRLISDENVPQVGDDITVTASSLKLTARVTSSERNGGNSNG